jgi:hypothetical protein
MKMKMKNFYNWEAFTIVIYSLTEAIICACNNGFIAPKSPRSG